MELLFHDMLCLVGPSSRVQQTPSSRQFDSFVTQRLEEKLRAARVNTVFFLSLSFLKKPSFHLGKRIGKIIIFMLGSFGALCMFQSKGESLQQQEASLEAASRLQSLRERDTVTRFDREVSTYLTHGCIGSFKPSLYSYPAAVA